MLQQGFNNCIYPNRLVQLLRINDKISDRYSLLRFYNSLSQLCLFLDYSINLIVDVRNYIQVIFVVLIKSRFLINNNMKKQLGISRNKTDRLVAIKKETLRKKNRFQIVGKEQQTDINSLTLTTTNSEPHSYSELSESSDSQSFQAVSLFKEARACLKKAEEIQKKMGELAKLRLSSLREKDNQKYDENISVLAGQATQSLFSAEKFLRKIATLAPKSPIQQKMLKSMQSSLAGEIQGVSRSLRGQQQEYFKKIKSYEGSTINNAIQLTTEQKKAMQGEWADSGWEMEKQVEGDEQKGKIGELVGSITRLSALYKQLGQLVVAQGTIIDRIDYNLQATQEHIIKGVQHLQGANEAASSEFAQKIIRGLFIAIVVLAVILGLKYMK